MSENIIDRLKRHEGLRLNVYFCPAGHKTCGYGHNLDAKGGCGIVPNNLQVGDMITLAQAEELLTHDLSDTMSDIRGHIPFFDDLDEARQDVLIDMTFNMGIGGLLKFQHMIQALSLNDYNRAADELKNSAYYHQVGDRAKENEQLIRNGGEN